jgi:hypothetical protein
MRPRLAKPIAPMTIVITVRITKPVDTLLPMVQFFMMQFMGFGAAAMLA